MRYNCSSFNNKKAKNVKSIVPEPVEPHEELLTVNTEISDHRSRQNIDPDDNSTCNNSLCGNPYSKSLPCCVRDILSGAIICKPTKNELKEIIEEKVDCGENRFKCCGSKRKVTIDNDATAHKLGVCNKEKHLLLVSESGNIVTLCESLCYTDTLGYLTRNHKTAYKR